MAKNFCLIYYFVPQDCENGEELNAFGIRVGVNKENVTLKDIKKSFPLEGEYIYRFKYQLGKQTVWMDLNSEDAKPPQYQGRIIIKSTRLSWENKKPQNLQRQGTQSARNLNENKAQEDDLL